MSTSPTTVHSPVTLAYPVASPRLVVPQRQHQQQLCLRNPGSGMPMNSPSQCLKSATLQSPTGFAQVTATPPTFTPSAVVFRNYRVNGGEWSYQTTNSPVMIPKKKETFQQPDCQYTNGGGGGGGGGVCISSNNSSLLSKTSDLIDTSDPKDAGLFGLSELKKRDKCTGDGENSPEFSDVIPQVDSPSSYQQQQQHQQVVQESGGQTTASQYVIHLPNCASPLTFANHHPMDVGNKREVCQIPGSITNFVTPTHVSRPTTAVKPAFRSLSIDSNLDNLSSSDFHATGIISPADTTRRGRWLYQRTQPPPLAHPNKRLNFIAKKNTLSPEIRGSFV